MKTQHLITHIAASAEMLDDMSACLIACVAGVQAANGKLVDMSMKKFQPQGLTILCLLEESHLSIHTWPERGTAAVDIFTCGEHTNPVKGLEAMLSVLDATESGTQVICRKV